MNSKNTIDRILPLCLPGQACGSAPQAAPQAACPTGWRSGPQAPPSPGCRPPAVWAPLRCAEREVWRENRESSLHLPRRKGCKKTTLSALHMTPLQAHIAAGGVSTHASAWCSWPCICAADHAVDGPQVIIMSAPSSSRGSGLMLATWLEVGRMLSSSSMSMHAGLLASDSTRRSLKRPTGEQGY